MGELDNTYIIYTADHGMAIGRHGLMGKQNLYQHTWRVPMIVAGPGIPSGTRAAGNVYLLDILATLCDFAGIMPPETNQGLSFRAVLEGRQPTVRDVLYGAYSGGAKPGIRCVRRGDWKLITWDAPALNLHQTQLFNLRDNPEEFLPEHHLAETIAFTGSTPAPHQTNLATDPAHATTLQEMQALLQEEMRRLNDPAAK
jgi:arylsulfatase A-like enzyme